MAGLTDAIKKEAQKNRVVVQDSESAALEKVLNKMFYLDKDPKEELKFLKQVITRGTGTQERFGLHASSMIVSDNAFCARQQVLSLIYKQRQGEQVSVGLKRIFEEGNAIHEKWQRMFIRAGYATAESCDYSQLNKEFEVSFTPDIICSIPSKDYDWDDLTCEIKSVNTFQFKKMVEKNASHPSGEKQLQFYMYLRGTKKGFTLCEDKNTQEFLVKIVKFDPYIVEPFVERLEFVKEAKQRVYEEGKMVKRHNKCTSATCKMAEECPMRDACYGIGMGKVKLSK